MAAPIAASVHEMTKPPHHSGSLTGIGEWYAAAAIQAQAAEAPAIEIHVGRSVDGRNQTTPAGTRTKSRMTRYMREAYRFPPVETLRDTSKHATKWHLQGE